MSKLVFNISPSSYNLYIKSPLTFYYQYVVKAEPDTKVVAVYGDAGNVVHKCLELYSQGKSKASIRLMFDDLWKSKRLDTDSGFGGRTLSKVQYLEALDLGMKKLDEEYSTVQAEEQIIFPMINNHEAEINLKGVIDLQVVDKKSNEYAIVDWKTSSSAEGSEDEHRRQGLFYAYLVYRKYKKIVGKIVFEYIKIGMRKEYKFSQTDLLEFEDELYRFQKDLLTKGFDMDKYDIGNIDNDPFNAHKQKCFQERAKRTGITEIVVERYDNKMHIKSELPIRLSDCIMKRFSYVKPGAQHSNLYNKMVWADKDKTERKRAWDGVITLFKNKTLPFAFYHKFEQLIQDYNAYFRTRFAIRLVDRRNPEIISAKYKTIFLPSKKKMYYYQKEAVEQVLKHRIGIVYLGTSGGKTLLSTDIIRKLNRRTLFIVNRIELVRQTREVFEEEFGIEVGEMAEGNLDIEKQITVSSIQTIFAILKRKDETTNQLQIYLRNITVCIMDESQNVSDAGMYGVVANEMKNVEYVIGLSGSPFRNGDGRKYDAYYFKNGKVKIIKKTKEELKQSDDRVFGDDTIEMNSLVGFPIYSKPTSELEREGFICPTKCYFIAFEHPKVQDLQYEEYYKLLVVQNERRNLMAKFLTEYFNGKKILILVKRIEHGEILSEMIPNSFFLNGSTPEDKRKDKFEEFKNSRKLILISMVKIVGAGINIPDLDVLINMSGHKSSVDSVQTIGRLKRLSEGKKCGYFIDFFDMDSFKLRSASKERIRILQRPDYGNTIKYVDDISQIKIE